MLHAAAIFLASEGRGTSVRLTDKVERIRTAAVDVPPPDFCEKATDVHFDTFNAISVDDVITSIRRLPDKTSAADPISTPVLKLVSDLLAPYITELFNRSMSSGQVPQCFKRAFITPIVKKAGLDSTDLNSYRLISNLSVLSKTLERLVARQLLAYLRVHNLLPPTQSGFRPGHSTETAILKVLSDILTAVDQGNIAALVLLDLTAAFDTVDHTVMLERLRRTFGITGGAHRWLQSYLSGRTQSVRRGDVRSLLTSIKCGVPQGSVLGPILFLLYTADLPTIIEQHQLTPHLYADDTQIYSVCRPADADNSTARMARCVDDVNNWMRANRLQLNAGKTELLWCSSARGIHKLPTAPMSLGGHTISPSPVVRDLGIHLDADLSMRRHIDLVVANCFAVLRQLRSIRQYVSPDIVQTLVTTLLLTRLDCTVFRRFIYIACSQFRMRRQG
jgi:hypothetical protein